MKPIKLTLERNGDEIRGRVSIEYDGRFDGVQVNTYVMGGSDLVKFTAFNDKAIEMPTRLFVPRSEMDKAFNFTAKLKMERNTRIRFRAAIIQEHKEIESDTVFFTIE